MNREIFISFINDNFPERQQQILGLFDMYFLLLQEYNRFVNLVSRKTSEQEIWTRHLLDSILPAGIFDLGNKTILDFGTGGGMPGIPLKIIFPESQVYLLDSRRKKIEIVKKMIKKLDLSECFTIVSRLEEMKEIWSGSFDVIVCRSVKILPKYKKSLLRLLKNEGELLLYKSKLYDDAEIFSGKNIIDVSHPAIGERKIIQIKKKWEGYE